WRRRPAGPPPLPPVPGVCPTRWQAGQEYARDRFDEGRWRQIRDERVCQSLIKKNEGYAAHFATTASLGINTGLSSWLAPPGHTLPFLAYAPRPRFLLFTFRCFSRNCPTCLPPMGRLPRLCRVIVP